MLLAFSSCGKTSISAVKQNPSRFAGKEVSLNGSITRVLHIPFALFGFEIANFQIYEIFDNADTMLVISVSEKKYNKGNQITAKGQIHYLGGDKIAETAEPFINSLRDFLVEYANVKEDASRWIAETVVKFLHQTLGDRQLILVMFEK